MKKEQPATGKKIFALGGKNLNHDFNLISFLEESPGGGLWTTCEKPDKNSVQGFKYIRPANNCGLHWHEVIFKEPTK